MSAESINNSYKKPVSIYYIKKAISKMFKRNIDLVSPFIKKGNQPGFLIRVDDFPHWKIPLEKFQKFHSIMKKVNIKYLLAVSPELLAEAEKFYLKELIADGVEIGMHGFAHEKNEVLINADKLGLKIESSLKIFRDINIVPKIFIPPHNTVSKNNLRKLSEYFNVVTGGEETIRFLGYWWGIPELENITYIPSYPPLYEKAQNIYNYILDKKLNEKKVQHLPITLHWSWELEDNFEGLRKLIQLIKNNTISWQEFLRELS